MAKLPVNDPAFWKGRVLETLARGQELHNTVYRVDAAIWAGIQERTGKILREHVLPGQRLLDAGCGYGALLEVLPDGIVYTGVDLSPDLLDIGRLRYPGATFECWDLRSLPHHYPPGSFDWALCRSLMSMTRENISHDLWGTIQQSILKVANALLIVEYTSPDSYSVVRSNP